MNLFGARRTRNRRRRAARAPWLRLPAVDWRRLGVSALALAAILAPLGLVGAALDQPIETIAVEGRFQRVAAVDVEQAVRQQLRGAGLVTVRLGNVRRAIEALPWVDSAAVQRAWPRGLRVVVVEQVAAARWGDTGLLNTRGELFTHDVRHLPVELPRLDGPEGTETQVAARYFAAQGRLVEGGLRIAALRLDPRGAWELELDDGVRVRFGRRQLDERFERFFSSALRLIAGRAADIAYVDMRYTNGFAVGWKTGGARIASFSHPAPRDDHPEA
jgi:cell division protein FtsQ